MCHVSEASMSQCVICAAGGGVQGGATAGEGGGVNTRHGLVVMA